MNQTKHLNNAPIIEAIIDIQAKFHNKPAIEALSNAHNKFNDLYPIKKTRQSKTLTIKIGKEGDQSAQEESEVMGLSFENHKEGQIVQFSVNGFSYHKLKPYTSWEEISAAALPLWQHYCEAAQPASVNRIALRYINRLEFPGHNLDFDDYLVAGPKVPKELPQGISQYLTRIVINEPTIQAEAIITQAYEGGITPQREVPVILDVDVFKICECEPSSSKVWEILAQLRNFKNLIFFKSLTQKGQEVFK